MFVLVAKIGSLESEVDQSESSGLNKLFFQKFFPANESSLVFVIDIYFIKLFCPVRYNRLVDVDKSREEGIEFPKKVMYIFFFILYISLYIYFYKGQARWGRGLNY